MDVLNFQLNAWSKALFGELIANVVGHNRDRQSRGRENLTQIIRRTVFSCTIF